MPHVTAEPALLEGEIPARAPPAPALDAAAIARYSRPVPRYTSYPTAPHFHGGVDAHCYGAWLEALGAEAAVSVYVHIPFCDSLCWFCGCHTKVVGRYRPIAGYLEALLAEVDLVAGRLGGRRRLAHLHWGGGSPTILRPDDIRRLAARLHQVFVPEPDCEFAVEIDPRGLTDGTVRALKQIGVNRVSIGVQDIDPEVQAAINRRQPFAVTADAVARLREEGIGAVNCDLMYGLPHQTTERVRGSVEAVLGLAPDRVALFGYAHVPGLKRHQRLLPEAALPDGAERLAQAGLAARCLEAAGYRAIGLDHFALPHDPLARAAAEGRLHRNFQGYTTDAAAALVGLGASAIGRLPQGYVQNQAGIRAYEAAIDAGRLATVRGLALDGEDRVRAALIERLMCDLEVDLARFQRYGFEEELAALAPLARDGLVTLDGRRVRVTPAGRPFLRSVAAVFDRYLRREDARHSQGV